MKPAILTILYLSLLVSNAQAQNPFAGGSGTEEDPYQIETLEQLKLVRNFIDRHFIQVADIDASETEEWNEGQGFDPIGDEEFPFTGSYDGNGHVIDGLHIDRLDEDYVGLFGYAEVAEISQVGFIGSNVRGNSYVGTLAGRSDDTPIINSYATGNVSGNSHSVGGLVGRNDGGSISNSYATGNVSSEEINVGGMVGWNSLGTISNSHAIGDVSSGESFGLSRAGGLVGRNEGGSISDSYAEGDVSGDRRGVGGLVGRNDGGTISNSYAEGNVAGDGIFVGGLVGSNSGDISNSYAIGNVSGNSHNVGGLLGSSSGDISDSHAEGEVLGDGNYVGGLIGRNSGDITDSYAEGNVSSTDSDVGGLVGRNDGGIINNSHATGDVFGDGEQVGGLVGGNGDESIYDGVITNSYATGNVSSNSHSVGGLVGRSDGGTISNSYAEGVVSGGDRVGGLVGVNYEGGIHASHANGEVSGSIYVGGLVGDNDNSSINNSYSKGGANGIEKVGGLVGIIQNDGAIESSFSTGMVGGTDDVGGFVGLNGAEIVSSYWNTDVSETLIGVGRGPLGDLQGLQTDQMTGLDAFENMTAFDFKEIWLLTEGHPALFWEDVNALAPPDLDEPAMVELVSPEDEAMDIELKPELVWDEAMDAETYQLQVSLDDDFQSPIVDEQEIMSTIYSVEDSLQYNTIYYWRVRGVNLAGESEWSQTWSFFTEYALNQPELVSPEHETEFIEPPVIFQWQPVKNADNYSFEIATDEDFEEVVDAGSQMVVSESQKKKTSSNKEEQSIDWTIAFEVESLEENETYFWKVQAHGDEGSSEWSDTWTFNTNVDVPETPVWEPADQEEEVETTPKLVWDSSERAETYHLQLSDESEFGENVLDVKDIPETEYQVSEELEEGVTYHWRIRAGNDAGYSNWSESLSFTTVMPTSTDQADKPVSYELQQNYPNPFNPSTQIRFAIPEQAHVHLAVYNMLGQQVGTLLNETRSPGWHDVTFDADGLSSGVFIYRIEAGEFVETRRMMFLK